LTKYFSQIFFADIFRRYFEQIFFSRYFPQILSIAANAIPELGLKLLALRLLRGARLGVRFERIADLVVDDRPVAVLVVGKERVCSLRERGRGAARDCAEWRSRRTGR
jgi:hypothetical protein